MIHMTELLYLLDNDYETRFEATVQDANRDYVVLDQTYFYPEGGGQPADEGTLEWTDGSAIVIDVQKDDGVVKHFIDNLDGELPQPGDVVHGEIDAERREKYRRMHTAQHVMSKVVLDEFDANVAGNQIRLGRSRIDFEPVSFTAEDLEFIQEQTNEIVSQDLPVEKKELSRNEIAERMPPGRVNLDLIPEHVDPLRVIEIQDFDLCPCGGTHVNSTREIGRVHIVNRLSKGAGVERIEFELED